MSVQFTRATNKIINKDGWSLWMPQRAIASLVNFAEPDIYAQSSTQLYPMGTKLEFADGRIFRYGHFGETSIIAPTARFVSNANICPGGTGGGTYGYEGTLDATSAVAIGTTTLVMNDTTDRAENFYEDGMLATYPSGHYAEYRIAGSEAATSVDDVTIYLSDQRGLQTLHIVNSTAVTAYPSIYSELRVAPAAAYESAVGMLLCDAMTDTYWGWVQRRGRCIVTPTAYFGDSANERMAQLHVDGTIALKAADATHTVGYLTQRTHSGYGDLEIWLTLE